MGGGGEKLTWSLPSARPARVTEQGDVCLRTCGTHGRSSVRMWEELCCRCLPAALPHPPPLPPSSHSQILHPPHSSIFPPAAFSHLSPPEFYSAASPSPSLTFPSPPQHSPPIPLPNTHLPSPFPTLTSHHPPYPTCTPLSLTHSPPIFSGTRLTLIIFTLVCLSPCHTSTSSSSLAYLPPSLPTA